MKSATDQVVGDIPTASRSAVVALSVLRDPALCAAVESALHATAGMRVTVTALRDLAAARTLASRARFDALLVDEAVLDVPAERQQMAEMAKRLPVIVIGAASSMGRSTEALRAGARDYVPIDDRISVALPAALRAVLSPASRAGPPALPRKVHGRTIGFVGVAGGLGTTSALLNCAVALSMQGRTVIAAELTSWASAFAAQLRQTPATGLADLLATPEHILHGIDGYLLPLPCGVRLLFGSPVPRVLTSMDAEPMDRVLHALAQLADVVLLDLPGRLPETYRQLARHLDQAVLVAEPQLSQGQLVSAAVTRLHAWGVGKARVSLLEVRRDDRLRDTLDPRQLAQALGVSYLGAVPAAPSTFHDAALRGLPVLLADAEAPAAAAFTAASTELFAVADHQRLKVAMINAAEDAGNVVSDMLDESDPVRFDLSRAQSVDDVLGEVSRGAFHAVLLFAEGKSEDLERDLGRLTGASDQTAVVVVSVAGEATALARALARGAQDAIELAHTDCYWLAHSLVTAIERQRQTHRMHAQHRQLETCEVSHRRIIMQLLRESQHDPRMV